MDNEIYLDYEEMMLMKNKRRVSREKGKKSYDKINMNKKKGKQRNVKNISYNPSFDYDYNEYEEY